MTDAHSHPMTDAYSHPMTDAHSHSMTDTYSHPMTDAHSLAELYQARVQEHCVRLVQHERCSHSALWTQVLKCIQFLHLRGAALQVCVCV